MADLVAGVFGARDQGKTRLAREMLDQLDAPRELIFDPMRQFADRGELAPSLVELAKRGRAARAFRLRYSPPLDDSIGQRFNAFCSLALDLGRLVLVVDELQLVTKPSWAPPSWRHAVLIGRHPPHELRIIATSQRPALVDATFRSNASVLATFRVNFAEDVRTMADHLGEPRERIAALPRFHYLARTMNTGAVHSGATSPPGKQKKSK
jgi:hypothetical protein